MAPTLNKTAKFSVFDRAGVSQNESQASSGGGKGRQTGGRLTESSGPKMASGAKIGGVFRKEANPAFLKRREEVWEKAKALRAAEKPEKENSKEIQITLPDGNVRQGILMVTTPLDIAKAISKKLANASCVARVKYTEAKNDDGIVVVEDDEEEVDLNANEQGVLWDLTRPLEGDCRLELLDFYSKEGKATFWHSSSHLLGAVLESLYGCKLTIGPPVEGGFYYDAYMGDETSITETEIGEISKAVTKIVNGKHPFERLVVTKEELLDMFAENPFKLALISTKIPDGGRSTVYKSGPIIDLCMGPHIPDAGRVKAFHVIRSSSAYWLGQAENDALQRVYGVAFPDKKELTQWKHNMAEAAKRDHRRVGAAQQLFFFDPLSPGSAFFEPRGARIYNTLVQFIRDQYWLREYEEVVTPNVYNFDLWHQSGHALHYKENMFCFDVEGAEFGLKPMNCPGHCLMFAKSLRSWRDLPLRYADFGVLHRNELSGALSGLTRVRRFQQDDAHIFCREDQVEYEVTSALDFMKYVYDTFGMSYKLELSTRPKKALGDISLWKKAEAALARAMDTFAGKGGWRVNPGDGAFYGPKVDIKVTDALGRVHQCATIQLDFQLPIRFGLKYKAVTDGEDTTKANDEKSSSDSSDLGPGFKRPIIIHRAMLGSVERMMAVLTEHWGGKWPFWISPRQCIVIPVADHAHNEYGQSVRAKIRAARIFCDCDTSGNTLPKKVRNAQLAQYNFILVVGDEEQKQCAVSVRNRNNVVEGTIALDDFIAKCKALLDSKALYEGLNPPASS